MKRLTKLISAALCLCMLLPFVVLGCTDKDSPRVLDDVEKSVVGKWEDYGAGGKKHIYTFNDDGTLNNPYDNKGISTFRHDGDGVYNGEEISGHYEVIIYTDSQGWNSFPYWLFDADPDHLYLYTDMSGVGLRIHFTRVTDDE